MQARQSAKPRELFHEYLERQINNSDVKQVEIADKLGFNTPNIITMFKQGKTKVPLEKVPGFAEILRLDPKMLLKMAMLEYCPELFRVIEKTFGGLVTKNEKKILDEIRRLTNNADPELRSIKQAKALEEFINTLI